MTLIQQQGHPPTGGATSAAPAAATPAPMLLATWDLLRTTIRSLLRRGGSETAGRVRRLLLDWSPCPDTKKRLVNMNCASSPVGLNDHIQVSRSICSIPVLHPGPHESCVDSRALHVAEVAFAEALSKVRESGNVESMPHDQAGQLRLQVLEAEKVRAVEGGSYAASSLRLMRCVVGSY